MDIGNTGEFLYCTKFHTLVLIFALNLLSFFFTKKIDGTVSGQAQLESCGKRELTSRLPKLIDS